MVQNERSIWREEPTSIRIGTSIPGIVPDSKNKSMEEIMPYIGDGSLVLKPASGKSRVYPFKEKWAITSAKYKGQKFGGLESATYGISLRKSNILYGYRFWNEIRKRCRLRKNLSFPGIISHLQ